MAFQDLKSRLGNVKPGRAVELRTPIEAPSGPVTVARLAGGLADLVYFSRKGKKPGTQAEKTEWSTIQSKDVLPALRSHSAELTIAWLVFFGRHPEVKGRFKEQPQDRQRELQQEFDDIRARQVRPWLALRVAAGALGTRTLYLVDDPVFRKLPDPARDAVGTALNDVFAFAGQTRGQAPIRVIFLDPDRFPESYNFADAVVRVVDGKLTDHLDQAHQRQRDNAQHSIQALGIRVTFEPATPSQSVAERLGSSLVLKTVVPAGRTRLAIPIMVAAVDLSAVSSEFVSYYQDEARMIQGGRTLRPTDPGYWNPAQKLLDTATVQGAAKLKAAPNKPEAWDAGLQAQFGTALGRSLAHEARHLYFADADNHAATGLGASDVGDQVVADRPAYRQFSVDDRKNILAAIGKREKEQRGTTLVATFPAARRANGFPF